MIWDKQTKKYVAQGPSKLEVNGDVADGAASHTKSVNLNSAASGSKRSLGGDGDSNAGRRSYQQRLSNLYPDSDDEDIETEQAQPSAPSFGSLWGVSKSKSPDPPLAKKESIYSRAAPVMDTVNEAQEHSDTDSLPSRRNSQLPRRGRRVSDASSDGGKPPRRHVDFGQEEDQGCCSCTCTAEGGLCYYAHLKDGVGPMAKPRKCRDVICLLFLVVFWIGMFVVFWYSYTEGCPDNCNDPRRLIFSTDSRTGEVCGTGNQTGKLRLYFPNPADPLSRRFCVEYCPPNMVDDAATSVVLRLHEGNGSSLETTTDNCFNPSSRRSTIGAEYGCYYPTYPTVDVLFKCVPTIPKNTSEAALSGLPQDSLAYSVTARFISAPMGMLGSVLAELQITWRAILGGCVVAVFLGFVWLILLRSFALCLVVTFGFLFLLACIAISLLAWDKAGMIGVSNLSDELAQSLDTVQVSSGVAQVLATVFSVVTAILLLLACCFARRIVVAVRLIQEAAQTIIDIPSIIFFPCTTFVSLALLAIMTFSSGLYLASAGEFDPVLGTYSYASTLAMQDSDCASQVMESNPLSIEYRSKENLYNISRAEAERFCIVYDGNAEKAIDGWKMSAESRLQTQNSLNMTALAQGGRSMTVEDWLGGGFREDLPFRASDYYGYLWLYHIFGTLWTYCFTTTALSMVIAGAVGHWYYREAGMKVEGLPVFRSLLRFLCFQMGTAACASFIIAIVWMARMVFQSIVKKMKVLKTVPLAGVALCLVNCCLECIERFVKYINRNAVIVAAIHGEGFCWSATKAFSLLLANVLRVASVSMSAWVLLMMGQAFVTAAATLTVYAYLRFDPLEQNYNLSGTPVATLTAVAILAFVIARLFMAVYWMVIEALLLCFFDDSSNPHPLPVTRTIEGRMTEKEILRDHEGHSAQESRRNRRV